MVTALVVAIAVFVGLIASAVHAWRYRRHQRYLDAIVGALKDMPDGTVLDIAAALGVSAFKTGSMYAELTLLERRGQITSRQDAETKRMHWSARDGAQ